MFCFINNILIGLYLRKNNKINIIKNSFIKENSLTIVLKKSILKAINTSFIILGNLIFFTIITNVLGSYINNELLLTFISGILELTNGIIKVSSINISLLYKLVITLFFLTFSGLSIVFQSNSILSEYKINIKKILTIKLVFSIFTCLLFVLIYLC